MAFGILPGIEVEVLQTFPGFVVGVGNTRLAVDKDIAVGILVSEK
jgi:Fe2+ transport system protein FeoA